jgi:hypothetical protein
MSSSLQLIGNNTDNRQCLPKVRFVWWGDFGATGKALSRAGKCLITRKNASEWAVQQRYKSQSRQFFADLIRSVTGRVDASA